MNSPDSSIAPTQVTSAPVSAVSRFRTAPFVLALLCFLMPFMRLSCAADRTQHRSYQGTLFVFGGQVAENDGLGRTEQRKVNLEPWALAAFCLAAVALLASLARGHGLAAVFALLAGVALVGFHRKVADQIKRESGEMLVMEADIGFILALGMLVVGLFWSGYLARFGKAIPPASG